MPKNAYIGVSDYTELKYIESTGTQYIDTGFQPSSSTRIVIDFENLGDYSAATPGVAPLFGARRTTSSDVFGMWIGKVSYPHYGDVLYNASGSFSVNINTRLIYEMNGNVGSIGEESITCAASTFTAPCDLYLLGMNTNGALYKNHPSGRIYSCQIYDNGTLIRDFVPCKNAAGAIGMYDRVTNTFYGNAGTGVFIAGAIVGSLGEGTARKIKKMYVGADYNTGDTIITGNNVAQYFTKANTGQSGFNVSEGGSIFNSNYHEANTTSESTFTALYDMDISFDYSCSTEYNDKFTIKVGDTVVANAISGEVAQRSWSGSIRKGQTIVLTYTKNASGDGGDDRARVNNLTIGAIHNVARKIIKAYIGVGGVARLCYISELKASLSVGRRSLAAASNGKYALFGGGGSQSPTYSAIVDAYDKEMVRYSPSNLQVARNGHAAASNGKYVVFGGGNNAGYARKYVDAYDTSLTRTAGTEFTTARKYLAAGHVGDYIVFSGGNNDSETLSSIEAYDSSLTKTTTSENMAVTMEKHSATTLADHVLFGGGGYASTTGSIQPRTAVCRFDASLTKKTNLTMGGNGYYNMAATIAGNYALFGGGQGLYGAFSDIVTAFNSSFTKSNPSSLSSARASLTATSLNGKAYFAGGHNNGTSKDIVDVYDSSLTRTIEKPLSVARYELASTIIGDHVLVAGGADGASNSMIKDTIDIYTDERAV